MEHYQTVLGNLTIICCISGLIILIAAAIIAANMRSSQITREEGND